jgi:hypothetical protein
MKIIVYVEGPSDVLALRVVLRAIIATTMAKGMLIELHDLANKKDLLLKGPEKAARIIANSPDAHVFLVPDLYPPNVAFPHGTFAEMKKELRKRFTKALAGKHRDESLGGQRFHVHCFKHDMEVLLLASEDKLKSHLGLSAIKTSWRRPPETQDLDRPPKRVIETIFRERGRRYRDTADAHLILADQAPERLADICPDSFGTFYRELISVVETRENK